MGAVISVRAWFGASKRVTPAPISVVPAAKAGETTSILPPLMQSIKTGNVANVEACLHAGKDVNQVGMWGNTPLICACQYGKERIALLLLDNGACVHSVNHKGANALLYACLEGLNTVVKRLVLSGNVSIETAHATIFNFTNDSYVEHSPLSAAAVNGHSQILSLLLKRFTWPPASLAAALTQAIMGKQRYCVELLLSSSSRTTYSDAVPYNYIGMEGLADVVDLLLRAGFDPSDMEPTLLAACEHDQQHVIQTLIKQGIKVDSATEAAFTCCRFHSKRCLEELLSLPNGVDLSAENEAGQTLSGIISQQFSLTVT